MADSEIRAFYSGKNFLITGGTGLVGLCLLERILRSLPDAGQIYLLLRRKRGKEVAERLDEIKENPMADSEIRAFYSGKNFLITGGTGLVGLCLLERILRSLPDAGQIYLLLRRKRGKEVAERLDEIKENPIFDTLLQTNTVADIFKKVVPIAGDVGEPNLGLSLEDRKLIDDVNIIVHSAAALDLDLNPKILMEINVAGTRRVLELACQLKGLKALVHVSSAAAHTFLEGPKEILYDVPENVNQIFRIVETLNEEALSLAEPTLLKNHRQFYIFTKHVAEHEVAKYAHKFPVTIIRPSLILTTWKEPVAGWTCSRAGMVAFIMGVLMGVIRRLPKFRENFGDSIPVDVVANQLLVAGYRASKIKGLSIYHCTSSTQNPYPDEIFEKALKSHLHKYPLKSAIWYPYFKTTASKISAIFIHFIPILLLDLFLRVTGRSSIYSSSKLRKIWKIMKSYEWALYYKYTFYNTNTIELAKQMNETDKKLFYIDISDIDWEDYSINMLLGIRKYLHHEDESTLEEARYKDTMLLVAHILWHVLLFSLLWYLVALLTGLTMIQSAWCVPVLYIIYSLL